MPGILNPEDIYSLLGARSSAIQQLSWVREVHHRDLRRRLRVTGVLAQRPGMAKHGRSVQRVRRAAKHARRNKSSAVVDELSNLHKNPVDETQFLHQMPNLPHPSVFRSELTSERLEIISQFLLEEFYATEDDLARDTDSGYTRGCTTFGRQRSRILSEALSGKYPWLGLRSSANDLVFTIEEMPCRFSNDDPLNPSKDAVLTTGRFQTEFMEFAAKGEPGRFCFVIDRGRDGTSEPTVVFLGFTPSGGVACQWVSGAVRVLRSVGKPALPSAVEVAKPSVAPKRRKDSSEDGAAEAALR